MIRPARKPSCILSYMHLRGVYVRSLLLLLCAVVLFFATYVKADTAIPIVRPADAKILYGGCDVDPFDILVSRYSTPRDQNTGAPLHLRPVIGADGTGQDGINPTLACRLMTLFQSLEKEKGCLIKIVSAFRSNGEQDKMCGSGGTGCLAAGKSCHNYGLAVDIEGPCVGQLRAFLGSKNPNTPGAQRFGLHFPYSGDHLQCIENTYANCRSGNGCDGKFSITPDLSNFPTASVPPTTAFANAIRQWFAPPAQQQPPQPSIPAQPLAQSPLGAFSASPTETNDNGNADIGGVSSQLDDSSSNTSNATSAADRLEELAFGPKSTTSTATSSIPLVVSGADAAALSGTQGNVTAQSTGNQGVIGAVQSTFSGDLSWQNGTGAATPSAPATGWQAALITMKAVLQKILQYLVPFGGGQEIQINGSGNFEALE